MSHPACSPLAPCATDDSLLPQLKSHHPRPGIMPCAILRPQPSGHTTDHRVYSRCFCSVRGISARPHQAACDLFSADGLPACALCTSVIYRVLIFGSSSSHFPSLSASNLSMLLGPEDLSTLRPILTFLHASGCVCALTTLGPTFVLCSQVTQ